MSPVPVSFFDPERSYSSASATSHEPRSGVRSYPVCPPPRPPPLPPLPSPLTLPSLPPSGMEATREGDEPRGVIQRIRAAIAASPWVTLAARIIAIAAGIVVLAVVGRLTTTKPAHASDATAASAGAAPAAPDPPASATRAEASFTAPAPLPSPSVAPPPMPASSARASADDPVFLNYASIDDLRRLPGAGHKRAEAIVALRQRMGRFQRVEDLLRVKGIGRATLRKWRPLLRLDPPPPPPRP